MKEFIIRQINNNDYDKKYLELLQKLTFIEPEKISREDFNIFIDNLNNNHMILVIENSLINIIIGSITILIESKFIHNLGKVCHIEDVVIDDDFRGLGLGKLLVNEAIEISKKSLCYKTILNCSNDNVIFYEKCGLTKNSVQMTLYNH